MAIVPTHHCYGRRKRRSAAECGGMTRRELLQYLGPACAALGMSTPAVATETGLEIGRGPHLFLDDWLIAESRHLSRVVQSPERLPEPVLTSARFGVTQPYLSVVRSPDTGRFRIWYNRGPAIWTAESADGVHWEEPRVAWDVKRGYGVSVVPAARTGQDSARRYLLANWQSNREWDDTPQDNGGVFVGFSPDGLRWEPYAENPVLRTYPSGYPKIEAHGVGDTVDAFYDPVHRRYACAVKVHALPEDGYRSAPKAGRIFRRLVGMTTSRDFVHWQKPWRILVPDERDEGLLEFYGMGASHARGPLLIGLARVLHDDLACDPGGSRDGIGYTVLVTSRDGVHWERDRTPFLDRSHTPGSWDHAMAWGSAVVPVGNEVYLYYGGYARGHKIAADRERQIGLARFRRDRYVARAADERLGHLRTRPFRLERGRLTLNARTRGGEIAARLLHPNGQPLAGFDWQDHRALMGDVLSEPLDWSGDTRQLAGETVMLELRLRKADLFGFAVDV